ncbi:DUF393 domain-containing protein [Urechidicola sp. KH5]
MKKGNKQPIILFDGVCNLCNTSVQFVLKNDYKKQFLFASLQSDAAKEILLQFSKNNSDLDSIILIYEGELYHKSKAILKVCDVLGGRFKLAKIGYILPNRLRDAIYDYIAKNRYKWYGKRENCMIPTPDLKARFLD